MIIFYNSKEQKYLTELFPFSAPFEPTSPIFSFRYSEKRRKCYKKQKKINTFLIIRKASKDTLR